MNQRFHHTFIIAFLVLSSYTTSIPSETHAGALSISPVRIILAPGVTSELITVRNESPDPVRLQLSLHAWSQDQDGTMQLTPSDDLIVFPGLLQLQANEARKVRIGLQARQDATVEKSYRIFLDELPGATKLEHNQVRVLARIGVPIFLQPKDPKQSWTPVIADTHSDGFVLQLKNTGNTHQIIQEISIQGLDSKDSTLFEQKLAGGYLLANSIRNHRVDVTPEYRGKLTSCRLHIITPDGPLKEPLRCAASSSRP